jgi:hypothetical protein
MWAAVMRQGAPYCNLLTPCNVRLMPCTFVVSRTHSATWPCSSAPLLSSAEPRNTTTSSSNLCAREEEVGSALFLPYPP